MPQSTSNGLTIEPLKEEDVPDLLSLIWEMARYESLEDEVTADEESLRATLTDPHPPARALIIRLSGRPVGYCVYFITYSTFLARPGLWIEDIYIQPQARRQGLGRAVFTHLGRLARDKGFHRIEWAVLNWNRPAIDFYLGLGAKRLDEWDVYRLSGADLSRLSEDD